MKKHQKTLKPLLLYLLPFLLGIVGGILFPSVFPKLSWIGTWYIKILKWLVYPLLVVEILLGVSSATKQFLPRLLKTVGLFIAMFVVSFLISYVYYRCIGLSTVGIELQSSDYVPATFSLKKAMSGLLLCILCSFVAGVILGKLSGTKPVIQKAHDIVYKIFELYNYVTPIGLFVLMGNAVATYGSILWGVGARYILYAWSGCLLITLLVMVLPAWLLCHISPVAYLKKACKVWAVSLSTCSSAATLPTTIRVCNEDFGVPAEITGIVVPLGCTIHMCGGAVSFCLLAVFTASLSGTAVTPLLFGSMLLVATLMNMAAPGIPGGGIILGATYLGILGLPTTFIGLYSGIYRLLDMAYTTLNVTGDITANLILNQHNK